MTERIKQLAELSSHATSVGQEFDMDKFTTRFAQEILSEVMECVRPQGKTAADRTMLGYFHRRLMDYFGIDIPLKDERKTLEELKQFDWAAAANKINKP